MTRTPDADGVTSQIVRMIPRERLDGAGCKNRVPHLRFEARDREYRLLISSWRKREAQALRRMMDAVALISPRTGTHHTLHRQRSAPAVVQSKVKEVRIKGYVKYGWRPAVPSLYLFGMKERAKG